MPFGINDLKSVIRIPTNWDLAYMRQFQTADGVTWDRVVARMGAALLLFNQSLRTGPFASFIRLTTDPTVEYMLGSDTGELPPMPEHNRPDLFAGDSSGHMIPMKDYGGGLGWTSLALRRTNASKLDLSIVSLIDRARLTWNKRLMERLFKSNVITVGAAGKSLPFADGGAGDSEYVPLPWDGKTFLSSHNHYLRHTDDATGRSASLVAMADHLREHGYESPYTLVVPELDNSLWTAQTEFVKPDRAAILTAGVQVRGVVPDQYTGIWETDRSWGYVMATNRLPVNYAGMFKPLGFGAAGNPLVVRSEAGFPLGLSIEGQVVQFPLQEAVAMFTFGMGIGQRTNGTCTYFAASGNYVDPTIT